MTTPNNAGRPAAVEALRLADDYAHMKGLHERGQAPARRVELCREALVAALAQPPEAPAAPQCVSECVTPNGCRADGACAHKLYGRAPAARLAPDGGEVSRLAEEVERLTHWLDAKYARHKEIEDQDAADLIRRLASMASTPASEPIPRGFRVTHNVDWDALTDEANAEFRWSIERIEAPYCGPDGLRVWKGPTLAVAMSKACQAIGIAIPFPTASASEPTDEQWYDIASAHATKDWNGPDFLELIKSVGNAARAIK